MPQLIDLSNKLILASASPRRKELLELIGIKCAVQTADIDETPHIDETAEQLVLRLAKAKANAILDRVKAKSTPNMWVLAADTTVVKGAKILNKPESKEEAFSMLKLLEGTTHYVYGGVVLLSANSNHYSSVVKTEVTFMSITDDQIRNYIESGEPMDKAGAYGAQGIGAKFIKTINGSYTNVVGLDIALVAGWLNNEGLLD